MGTPVPLGHLLPSPEQERIAREVVATPHGGRSSSARPIVTEIVPASTFHMAEDYHQEYYERVGSRNPYCSFVIDPKVTKFRSKFFDRLKRP